MKFDVKPETPLERALLAAGAVPLPLLHTMVPLLMSRTILSAVRFGVFESLAEGARTSAEIATACGIDPRATEKLLTALGGIGYVRKTSGRYELAASALQWLTPTGRRDLSQAVLHRYLDMRLLDSSEDYLRTGKSSEFHQHLSDDEWKLYVDGQRSMASLTASEVARRVPVPGTARNLLDLGGGHGLFSQRLAERHPNIRIVVFDLPQAVQQVDRSQLSERISFRAGNVLTDEPGDSEFDVVFACNLIHHFNQQEGQAVFASALKALRPGGTCIIADFVRETRAKRHRQIPALLDFYFAVISGGGVWTREEIETGMTVAGFSNIEIVRMKSVPGMALMVGRVEV